MEIVKLQAPVSSPSKSFKRQWLSAQVAVCPGSGQVFYFQTFEDFDQGKHQYVCHVLKYFSENNYNL
jgi:hypothetical protein